MFNIIFTDQWGNTDGISGFNTEAEALQWAIDNGYSGRQGFQIVSA
jgi:hypothetical protein